MKMCCNCCKMVKISLQFKNMLHFPSEYDNRDVFVSEDNCWWLVSEDMVPPDFEDIYVFRLHLFDKRIIGERMGVPEHSNPKEFDGIKHVRHRHVTFFIDEPWSGI